MYKLNNPQFVSATDSHDLHFASFDHPQSITLFLGGEDIFYILLHSYTTINAIIAEKLLEKYKSYTIKILMLALLRRIKTSKYQVIRSF